MSLVGPRDHRCVCIGKQAVGQTHLLYLNGVSTARHSARAFQACRHRLGTVASARCVLPQVPVSAGLWYCPPMLIAINPRLAFSSHSMAVALCNPLLHRDSGKPRFCHQLHVHWPLAACQLRLPAAVADSGTG